MKAKTRRRAKLIFFIAVALISINVYAGYRNDIAAYNVRINELDKEISKQRSYGAELDSTGNVYESQESVEQIARDTLGLVKSGEKFFKNYNDNQ